MVNQINKSEDRSLSSNHPLPPSKTPLSVVIETIFKGALLLLFFLLFPITLPALGIYTLYRCYTSQKPEKSEKVFQVTQKTLYPEEKVKNTSSEKSSNKSKESAEEYTLSLPNSQKSSNQINTLTRTPPSPSIAHPSSAIPLNRITWANNSCYFSAFLFGVLHIPSFSKAALKLPAFPNLVNEYQKGSLKGDYKRDISPNYVTLFKGDLEKHVAGKVQETWFDGSQEDPTSLFQALITYIKKKHPEHPLWQTRVILSESLKERLNCNSSQGHTLKLCAITPISPLTPDYSDIPVKTPTHLLKRTQRDRKDHSKLAWKYETAPQEILMKLGKPETFLTNPSTSLLLTLEITKEQTHNQVGAVYQCDYFTTHDNGHWRACLKIGDVWYLCDDLNGNLKIGSDDVLLSLALKGDLFHYTKKN